jgi:hypothetical protein
VESLYGSTYESKRNRLWRYRKNDVHSRDTKQVDLLKIDALERKKEEIKDKHEELRHKLQEFWVNHLERLADIEQLHYKGKK